MSRWENAPTTRELVRLTGTPIDLYCASYPVQPAAVALDIDDTVDVVHDAQQVSLWNGNYGERCLLPIHVYDTATARPVAMLLRTGKTPSASEVAGRIRRLIRRIRRHWPTTQITLRGDGHYGHPEPMAWCEANDIDYIFGCPTTARFTPIPSSFGKAMPARLTGRRRVRRVRCFAETRYAAKTWGGAERLVVARIEESSLGLDICFVATSLADGSAERIYDMRYCARGQAENPIKLHKTQLKSDRTACRSANANQMIVIRRTAADWQIWAVRHAMPATVPLRTAEFATIRPRLLKVAARVIEIASRVRIAFASACPDAALFRSLALNLRIAGP